MPDGDSSEREGGVRRSSSFSNGHRQNGHNGVRGWLKSWWRKQDGTVKEALEEAIEEVLEEHQDDAATLKPEEAKMLRNILSFGEITVHDIMTPRPDIIAVPADIVLADLKAMLAEQRHTRMPVYSGSLDHIDGFLHMKDLLPVLSGDAPYDLKQVMRPILFIPPSMRVVDLLVKMRESSSHIAIVVDEYGGTDGLITLEDLFEEIVGEIQDEHDEDEPENDLIQLGNGTFEADARVRVERLEEELGIQLTSEDGGDEFDTLGGFIFSELGRVPSRGEILTLHSGMRFEILEVDPRRIHRVRISPAIAEA